MKDQERILTLHPQGKSGVRISKRKYDLVRDAILEELGSSGDLTWKELSSRVTEDIEKKLDGSPDWYFTTVKLDLEARNEITVTRSRNGQIIGLR